MWKGCGKHVERMWKGCGKDVERMWKDVKCHNFSFETRKRVDFQSLDSDAANVSGGSLPSSQVAAWLAENVSQALVGTECAKMRPRNGALCQ